MTETRQSYESSCWSDDQQHSVSAAQPNASLTGCSHAELTCRNAYELLPIFDCRSCRGVLICECEAEWFDRYDQSKLSRALEVAKPADGVCFTCRGESEPEIAYGRSRFSRQKWREIFKRWSELYEHFELGSGRIEHPDLMREAENQIRREYGVPEIGKKWTRETRLFDIVEALASPRQVLQHARPNWLGNQHLDIYVPECRLAVEYMGEQHRTAFRHLGGVDGLRRRQALDRRKRRLCQEHRVRLIEFGPENEISEEAVAKTLRPYLRG